MATARTTNRQEQNTKDLNLLFTNEQETARIPAEEVEDIRQELDVQELNITIKEYNVNGYSMYKSRQEQNSEDLIPLHANVAETAMTLSNIVRIIKSESSAFKIIS